MPASASPPPTPPPITEKAGERWVRIKAVFGEALEVPESERSAFVARACEGDVTLRMEIESLLTNEKAAVGFLETPAVGLLAQGAPASPRLEPGTRLGAYEITAFLSAAGMGEVYRARHTVLGRQVAVKTVSARAAEPTASRRLVREAQHASILNHPNICSIFEVGDADGTPFIIMELVEGRSLHERLHDRLPQLEGALRIGSQVADALEHAHRHGIVHRERLGQIDPDQQRLVELRFFAGLTVDETAHVLNRSPRTVKREWQLAKAWLFRELSERSMGSY